MARHATLVAPRDLLDDELVVLDLDDLTPGDPTRGDDDDGPPAFEARYATLPFGLGTVPRRIRAERASRTPMWLLALAAVAMVAVLAGNPSSSTSAPTPSTPVLEAPTGARVAVVGYDRMVALDVDSRTSHIVRLAGLRDGDAGAIAPAGDRFVVVVDGHAWSVSRLLDRPAVDLGAADDVFAATNDTGATAVLVVQRRTDGWAIRSVDPATGRAAWQSAVPPTQGVVGSVDGAAVVDGAGAVDLVGDRAAIRIPARGALLGAANRTVATLSCSRHACTIGMTDVRSGRTREVPTPLRPGAHVGHAVFGPGGRMLAALIDGDAGASTRVVVVRGGNARLVDTGGRATGLAWSGDWLFALRADGQLVAIGDLGAARLVDADPLPTGALVGLPAS